MATLYNIIYYIRILFVSKVTQREYIKGECRWYRFASRKGVRARFTDELVEGRELDTKMDSVPLG